MNNEKPAASELILSTCYTFNLRTYYEILYYLRRIYGL